MTGGSSRTAAGPGAGSLEPGISPGLLGLFAASCGLTVANLYYAQPLLSTIAAHFHVADGTAGLLVTVSQVAYAAGLLFLVPLGDVVNRRPLTAGLLLLLCCAGLVAAALASSLPLLATALGLAATSSVVVQILIPFAATLAPPEQRGRVLGTLMSGTLIGILLARTVSGLLASAGDWRTPFAAAAVAMGLLAVVLWRVLPDAAAPVPLPYRRLLTSVAELVRTEPLLQQRMVYGACCFASFTLVWTTLPFLLSGEPYNFPAPTIGLFGLVGVAGALAARPIGSWSDRGHTRAGTGAVLALILGSWGLLALGRSLVVVVIGGLVFLDLAVQGQNVLSQGEIYMLGHDRASRLATAYIVSNFSGGAIGSALGSLAWTRGGWEAVCATGAAVALLPLGLWLAEPGRLPRIGH